MLRINDRTYVPVVYLFFGQEGDQSIPVGRGWIDASTTDHIFSFILSENSKRVIVKVINHFGEEFTEVIDL